MPLLLASVGHTVRIVFGAGLTGAGVLAFAVALSIALGARRARARGVRAAGRIVGYELPARGVRSATRRVEHPIVEFTASGSGPMRTMARNGSSPRPGRVGAAITVYYNPTKPSSVYAETRRSRGVSGCMQVIFVAAGMILFVYGVSILQA